MCAGVSCWAKQCIHYICGLGMELKLVERRKGKSNECLKWLYLSMNTCKMWWFCLLLFSAYMWKRDVSSFPKHLEHKFPAYTRQWISCWNAWKKLTLDGGVRDQLSRWLANLNSPHNCCSISWWWKNRSIVKKVVPDYPWANLENQEIHSQSDT